MAGFGISTGEQASTLLKAGVNGIIAGSVFARIYEKHLYNPEDSLEEIQEETEQICHPDWREFNSWKNSLNNWRIMIQPMILFCSILPWLNIIKSLDLLRGFNYLLGVANQYMINFPSG